MRVTSTALGPLSCRVVDFDETNIPRRGVVLCHGFGAPGDDLVGLADALVEYEPSLKDTRFLFPEAPLDLAEQGYPHGRAWWHIDFDRLQRPEGFRKIVPEGLDRARRLLSGTLDAFLQKSGFAMNQVVLGGFSQGAMLTCDLTFRLEEAPRGLAILSGTLICEDEWKKRAGLRRGLRVFQTHGTEDPLLSFSNAQALQQLLLEAGLGVEFVSFNGGHGVPMPALRGLAAFLCS